MEKALRRYWWIFVLPTLLAFTIGFVVPFLEGLYLSFCHFTTVSNAEFVGIENFAGALTDTAFLRSVWFTVLVTVVNVISVNVIGFALAMALTAKLKGTNIFRTVFFMPNLIGGIVLGYIWQILINAFLSVIGQPLLALNATAGYWGIIILTCWQQVGYMMIIYIAGLQNVPDDLIEAAKIDGATDMQILWKIKIPIMMPSITICVFLTLTNSLKLFDQNLALTAGDPVTIVDGVAVNETEMIALNIFNSFTLPNKMYKGISQAKALIFSVVVVLISFLQLRMTRSKEVQA